MVNDLKYLVHFFNDDKYLFQTITMTGEEHAGEICDKISAGKGWFWGRFAPSERHAYMQRRLFVEKSLYAEFIQDYGPLKEMHPVYFYIYPKITLEKLQEMGRLRTNQDEVEPHILVIRMADIKDASNMTFTLNDSCRSYWKKTKDAGIPFRGDQDLPVVLEDHNKVFPFSMIEQIHQKYAKQGLSYEVQIWDHQLLEKLKIRILN